MEVHCFVIQSQTFYVEIKLKLGYFSCVFCNFCKLSWTVEYVDDRRVWKKLSDNMEPALKTITRLIRYYIIRSN